MTYKKIEFAQQDRVKQLQPYIALLLAAFGHPEAWVSDESLSSDFESEHLVDMAERLKAALADGVADTAKTADGGM